MRNDDSDAPLPAYTYVPGGPWPHPNRAVREYWNTDASSRRERLRANESSWRAVFQRGVELFNAGYYWEAHEVWEELWHVEERRGATGEALKGLIKLAAAGVKAREGRENGVRTHCRRAAESFASAASQGGAGRLGLNLDLLASRACQMAEHPPLDPGPPRAAVTRVFAFKIEPVSEAPTNE
jgi:predicted metal-dependent hydrolase